MTVLCGIDDIPDGGSKGVLPGKRGRDRVLLVRKGSRVFGYINNCPHYDRAPLGWKRDEFLNGEGTHIMCAAHGALFDIENGECQLGPCLGQALRPVPLRVEGSRVFLEVPLDTLIDTETGTPHARPRAYPRPQSD